MRTDRNVRNERGVTLVVMAMTVFLVLGMGALAIDYGMVKAEKAEGQRAMDAAALAGAGVFLIADPLYDKVQGSKDTAWKYAQLHTVGGKAVLQAEVTPVPDVANEKLTVTFQRSGIKTWFANSFGTSSFGFKALAAAHVQLTNVAHCVKPVAIPDVWDNKPHIVDGHDEDWEDNDVWDYKDENSNGLWDSRETEQWTFDPGLGDNYTQANTGYGTDVRNGDGYTNDYGRPMMLMALDPKDRVTPSFYYAWHPEDVGNGAPPLADAIRGAACNKVELGVEYPRYEGGKVGPVSDAWDDLIAQDGDAYWYNGAVVGSSFGANWLTNSPRVVVIGLYNPSLYGNEPSDKGVAFNNLAKVWVERVPGDQKAPATGRFLGFVSGGGGPGEPAGTQIKELVLIK